MEIRKTELCPSRPWVTLTAYLSYSRDTRADAVLICPGGGYYDVCDGHEGDAVAIAFAARGFRTFVLRYSVKENAKFPTPLADASLAICHIKDHAEEYGIDPEELFVAGFSAGGHLAGLAATRWKMEEVYEAVADLPYGYNKPKGVMMIYPAVNSRCANCERYSQAFGTLFGCKEPSDEQLDSVSVDFHVDADSVPVFVMHTFNDKVVDVRNVMLLGTAYANAGIPFEMHVYPDGPHGLSVANAITAWGRPRYINSRVAEWVRLAAEWAETL